MKLFKIIFQNLDRDKPYVAYTTKWAREKNEAIKYAFKKLPDKQGICVTKRGTAVKILNIEEGGLNESENT